MRLVIIIYIRVHLQNYWQRKSAFAFKYIQILGEDLIQREDDKPESVKNRLEVFSKNTKPVLDFYREMGILKDFHGTESKKIWPHVEEHLKDISK